MWTTNEIIHNFGIYLSNLNPQQRRGFFAISHFSEDKICIMHAQTTNRKLRENDKFLAE